MSSLPMFPVTYVPRYLCSPNLLMYAPARIRTHARPHARTHSHNLKRAYTHSCNGMDLICLSMLTLLHF